MFDPLRTAHIVIDLFKSDETLMREETTLFAQIMQADEHEQSTGEYNPPPKHVFTRHIDKMTILCKRGHVTDENGGWES